MTTETAQVEAACVFQHRKPMLADRGLLCSDHLATMGETLQDVFEYYVLLPLYLLPGAAPSSAGDIKHTKNPEAPAPVNLAVISHTDRRNHYVRPPGEQNWWASADIPDVLGILTDHAQNVVTDRVLKHAELNTLIGVVNVLRTHNTWIADQYWVTDYYADLRMIRRSLALASGEPATPKPLGPCPAILPDSTECGTNLFPTPGTGAVTCKRCKAEWSTPAELLRLKLMMEG
jgi:hypothetical protein